MRSPRRQASAGFTYLGVLLAVAFLGVFLGLVGEVWRTAQQREAERDLRFVGDEFRRAIGHYYEATPGAVKRYPRTLKDLLRDDRFPGVRRYLRRIYRDPITLRQEWGLVAADDGGISGVFSLSGEEPIGRMVPVAPGTAEPPEESAVTPAIPGSAAESSATREATKDRYADWRFVYVPPVRPRPPPASAAEAPERPGSTSGAVFPPR